MKELLLQRLLPQSLTVMDGATLLELLSSAPKQKAGRESLRARVVVAHRGATSGPLDSRAARAVATHRVSTADAAVGRLLKVKGSGVSGPGSSFCRVI